MKATVIGKEVVDYVSRKSGERKRGVRLHLVYVPDKTSIEGMCCSPEYFSDRYRVYEDALQVKVNDEVDLIYNNHGYTEGIVILPPSSAAGTPADKK